MTIVILDSVTESVLQSEKNHPLIFVNALHKLQLQVTIRKIHTLFIIMQYSKMHEVRMKVHASTVSHIIC